MDQKRIPEEDKIQIFEDLASNLSAESETNTAVCYFIGFGCVQNHETGLLHMLSAARKGDITARAILARLYQACNQKIPPDIPITEWLEEATAAGSRIASTDLLLCNPTIHARGIERFRNRFCGLLTRNGIDWKVVEDLSKEFNIHDEHRMAEAIQRHFNTRRLVSAQLGQPTNISVDTIEYKGWNLLQFASTLGYVVMLDKLLSLGFTVNHQNFLGETALLCACRSARCAAAELLLDKGASAAIRDGLGSTPLHYLIYMDERDIKHIAAKLLSSRADIHAKSLPINLSHALPRFIGETEVYSDTPLHWAVAAGRLDVVKVLLDFGANPGEPSDIAALPVVTGGLTSGTPEYISTMDASSALNEALAAAHIEMAEACVAQISCSRSFSLPLLRRLGAITTNHLEHM
jgi:Ankyrin repeat